MNKKPKKSLNPYLRFTSVAFQMGGTIWLGNMLGEWLDNKYQTTYLENTITLLAVFTAMYLVISQVLKISKDND
ncbi:MAG: AtpZ/AtpI family protein [Lacinutrix sp.]|uniref:AtpZ/AtpI family protein n=1 Tax=Lacinutrix sp. TaxID=1937692 RepID=UPI003094B2F8